jgi:hypothetical protein
MFLLAGGGVFIQLPVHLSHVDAQVGHAVADFAAESLDTIIDLSPVFLNCFGVGFDASFKSSVLCLVTRTSSWVATTSSWIMTVLKPVARDILSVPSIAWSRAKLRASRNSSILSSSV